MTSSQRSIVCDPSMRTSGSTIGTSLLLLAQRRVPCERAGIGTHAGGARQTIRYMEDRPPLREAGTQGAVFCEAIAQTVEAFGDALVG